MFAPLLWAAFGADVPTEQKLIVQVAAPGERSVEAMSATLTREGGVTTTLTLSDAVGEQAGTPYDGIWSGVLTGTPERYAQLVLEVTPAGEAAAVAFQGVVRTEDLPVSLVGFRLSPPDAPLLARRAVFALPGHAAEEQSARPVWAAFGWLWAAVFWVGAMVANARREEGPE